MDFLSTGTKKSGYCTCREVAVSGDSTVVNYCIKQKSLYVNHLCALCWTTKKH